METTILVLLWILAVVNIGWGVWAMWASRAAADLLGFELKKPSAHGEIRAVYGGLVLGLGVMIVVALQRPDPGEWMLALAIGFLFLTIGRLMSCILDGASPYTLMALGGEGSVTILLYAAHEML